jgi:serine/threonine-protein kinase
MQDLVARLNGALQGRYHVERQLGEGGMATVYLAEDLRHRRRIALKVLKPELAAVVGAARFLAEIETTAKLQHPHILPLFDSGEADGLLFYVMPHVEGESLLQRLDREHQLPVDEAVRIATNVAEALDYAHRNGVIHRDIKPANILLLDGKPVVTDFGIARAVSHAGVDRLTETGVSLGTPHYMSPEQATGDQTVGPATDVWALGCVLYEMLVGEPPYTGSTPQAVLGRIITAEPIPVTERRRTTPPNVEAALERALMKVPADRFGSAEAFARALADPGFRFRAGAVGLKGVGKLPLAASVGAAFLAGALVVGALVRAAGPGTGDPSAADAPIVGFKIAGVYGATQGRVVAISPDGSLLASVSGLGLSVRSISESDVAIPVRSDGAQPQPFFSPDGGWIGYFAGVSANLMRVAVTGGAPSLVATGRARALGGSWGSDDTIVFATTEGLYRVPAAGGEPELIAAPNPDQGELYYTSPEVMPGGAAVLFSIQPQEGADDTRGTIAALDLTSLEQVIVLRGGSGPRYSSTGHLLYSSGGALFGVAFDPNSLRASREPVALSVDGIHLTRGFAPDFDIADNGTLVYVPAAAQRRLRTLSWVSRDGTEEPIVVPPRPYGYLRVSPDGSRIAMDIEGANRDVYVWDLGRSTLSRITNDPGEDFFAHWSPDSRRLFYSSNRSGIVNVYSQYVDGTGEAELVVESNAAQMLHGVWPRGNRVLASQEQDGGGFDVVAWELDEPGRADTLVATQHSEMNAVLSPDGEWIAYSSDQEGRLEVYATPLDDPTGRRWKVSVAGGDRALWSPAGDEIYYQALEGGLMAATVRRAPTFEVGVARQLLPAEMGFPPIGGIAGRAYDVSPIDGRFLVSKPVNETESNGIMVITNWSRELRERIPTR